MIRTSDAGVSSFWLMPAPDDEALLAGIVDMLATRHGTPRFAPHLTLMGNVPLAPEGLGGMTASIAEAAGVLSLPVADIVTGDAFFRSFYALFKLSRPLAALRGAAAEATGLPAGDFMPHVSLLYGAVAAEAKEASAAEVRARLKGRALMFDRVVVTSSSDDVPIEQWQIVCSRRLGGV